MIVLGAFLANCTVKRSAKRTNDYGTDAERLVDGEKEGGDTNMLSETLTRNLSNI